MYSDRGNATVTGVVETVVALPCRVMGAVASVMSGEVLLPRWSGVRRPSLDGVGQNGACVRGPGGSGESEVMPEALMIIISMFFRVFCCSDLGISYYGTQHNDYIIRALHDSSFISLYVSL